MIKSLILSPVLFIALAIPALTQDAATTAPPSATTKPIDNPFDDLANGEGGMMGGGMGGMMAGGMDGSMGMGMAEAGGDMYGGGMGGYGMDMGMGGSGVSPEENFRLALRKAISKLSSSQSDEEKASLMRYTQDALQQQYDKMIQRRRDELNRLKQSLAKLETDLQKREAAKDRVIKLQMQTVTLAAEGLLDLNTIQPSAEGYEPSNGYGGEYGGVGMGN